MYVLPKEQFMAIARATTDDYFLQWHRAIRSRLLWTRLPILRHNRVWLWSHQNHLAKNLTLIEEAIQRGKQEAGRLIQQRDTTTDAEEKERLSKRIQGILDQREVHERIRLAIKGVCDGIAWRALRFDRNIIRVLSEADTPGHLKESKAGAEAERRVHYHVTERLKHISIRNDLTNYLRIGDITEVDYPLVLLHEVKAHKKGKKWRLLIRNPYTVKKSDKLSRQMRRMFEAQLVIQRRRIPTIQGIVEFMETNIPYRSHLRKIKRTIRKAHKKGHACVRLEDCLSVECRDWKKTVEEASRLKREVWKEEIRCDDWGKDDHIVAHSNYDTFSHQDGQFLRNVVPYAVFPLPNNVCADLMLGSVTLVSKLNLELLGKRFEQAGWSVEFPDWKKRQSSEPTNPKEVFSGHLFDHAIDETIMTIGRKPFYLEVPYSWIERLTFEFATVDTLVQFAEHIYKTAERGKPRMITGMIKAERKFWR